MPFVVIAFGCGMAFALCRERVNDNGAIFDLLRFAECFNQRPRVMTVDVTDIFETEFVDQSARQNRGGNGVLHGFRRVVQALADRRDRQQCFFDLVFEAMITVRFANSIQVTSQRADCRRDRHLVVI